MKKIPDPTEARSPYAAEDADPKAIPAAWNKALGGRDDDDAFDGADADEYELDTAPLAEVDAADEATVAEMDTDDDNEQDDAFDHGAVLSALSGAKANADDDDAETQSADVLMLVPAAEDTDGDATPAVASESKARALWGALSRDVDMSDPDAILACVERLLGLLDGLGGAAPDGEGDDSDAADALIHELMSRRKP